MDMEPSKTLTLQNRIAISRQSLAVFETSVDLSLTVFVGFVTVIVLVNLRHFDLISPICSREVSYSAPLCVTPSDLQNRSTIRRYVTGQPRCSHVTKPFTFIGQSPGAQGTAGGTPLTSSCCLCWYWCSRVRQIVAM